MNLQLTGNKALVTGSTAGIGFATRGLLARAGARVVVNGRSTKRVAGAVSRICAKATGAKVDDVPAEMIHYCMRKSAQISIARGLAETTVGTGVTINSVLPGPTRSEGVATFVEQLAKEQGLTFQETEKHFFETARPTPLLKRFSDPKKAAALVIHLCSPVSSATNGAALRVEGGVVRSMI